MFLLINLNISLDSQNNRLIKAILLNTHTIDVAPIIRNYARAW